MNILFMTIAYPRNGEQSIYTDLMKEFMQHGHKVYVVCSEERRNGNRTAIDTEDMIHVLRIRTGNLTGVVSLIEKGITTITIEKVFIHNIKHFLGNIRFDLILYSTPPITFVNVVRYIKKKDKSLSYLLLKDIFPQNAVDIGMIGKGSLLYRYLHKKEKRLYEISDYIGCMSEKNVEYIKKSFPDTLQSKAEVCPNSMIPSEPKKFDKAEIRRAYHIPIDAITFIYGGNLGKPQGIDFLIECLEKNMNHKDRFFVICGKGSDYNKLEAFFTNYQPENMVLINGLPKKEYDVLVKGCDVGMIFLNYRFTIPNFPSRLLSYMDHALPVFACTDKNTDIGEVIRKGEFGWWCESNNSDKCKEIINQICSSKEILEAYGKNSRAYLENFYCVHTSYDIIMRHTKQWEDKIDV